MRKKGGFADAFYTSYAWRQCAAAYRESRGYLCERCLARGIVTTAVEVHHIKHLTRANIHDPDEALAEEEKTEKMLEGHVLAEEFDESGNSSDA